MLPRDHSLLSLNLYRHYFCHEAFSAHFEQPSFPASKPRPFSFCLPAVQCILHIYCLTHDTTGEEGFSFVDYPEPSTVLDTYWALNQYLLIMLIKHRKVLGGCEWI